MAAQIAAFFADLSGGRIEKLKLIKLIYLFERESIEKRGRPGLYDEYYSIANGPICTNSLDGINGVLDKEIWSEYVGRPGGNLVQVQSKSIESLDELSESDRLLLAAVWEKFGWMTASQIRNWTHRHCAEYVEVPAGRMPIACRDIGAALGMSDPEGVERRVHDYRSAEAATGAK